MCFKRFLFRGASALLATIPAIAQQKLSLPESVSEALARSLHLRAANSRIAVAGDLKMQAGLAPNPRLTLQTENSRSWGQPPHVYPRDTDNFAYIGQLIETAGKRGLRTEFAAAGVRKAELEQRVIERQITRRVSTAYWMAAGAARVRDLLQENLQTFERIVRYHRDRVAEGAAAEIDLMRVQLEQDRLIVSHQSSVLDADRELIALFREMGRIDFGRAVLTEMLDDLSQIEPVDMAQILESRDEVRVARQSVELALANVRLQQAIARPDVDVFLGYKRTAGQNTLYGAVQIPLAFRNRNQGLIAAASDEVSAARTALSIAQNQVQAEVAAAQREYDSRLRLITSTLKPMRQRAEEMSRITQAAYAEGGGNLLRLLDGERIRIEAQILYFKTLAEYHQSSVALQAAMGVLQ